jgi:hypothetical protein
VKGISLKVGFEVTQQAHCLQITACVTFLPLIPDPCEFLVCSDWSFVHASSFDAFVASRHIRPADAYRHAVRGALWLVSALLVSNLGKCKTAHAFCCNREESDPRYINCNVKDVKLRAFTTKVHTVDALVSFKSDG